MAVLKEGIFCTIRCGAEVAWSEIASKVKSEKAW